MTARAGLGSARWQALAASVALASTIVASGDLECEPMLESRAVAHGREVYGRMCAVCHGATGEGYKADQAPALSNQAFLSSVSDPFLVTAITAGRTGSTMSAWGSAHGGPLGPADVDAVVELLRTWQRSPMATLDERPVHGDVAAGGAAFVRECAKCHGANGKAGSFVSIGNSQLLATATNGFLRAALRDGRPGTAMTAFQASLGDQGVEDVLAYLRSLPTNPPPGQSMFAPPARPPPLPLGPVPLNPRGPEPVGFSASDDAPKADPHPRPRDPRALASAPASPAPGFTNADVVHAELRRGARLAILDARAPSDYAGEHIAGAVSVPFYDPEPYVSALPRDAWLVCYCGCPHAESGQLAQKLRAKGFTKVTVIDEGLRYWKTKGYGTHEGLLP